MLSQPSLRAWGGTYQSYYKEQSLNGKLIQEFELQPIKFQGQSLDIETGLHYNRFRYYDSDVGIFIQRDPIGLLGGVNVFAYAPNPIHWVDVLGLKGDKYFVYGLYQPGAKKPFYIGITDNLTIRSKKHRSDGRLVGEEQMRPLYSGLDEPTARGYEEGCIDYWNTLTGVKLKKGETSNFKDDDCKTRGNKCHSFLENDDRDKARQKKMVAGREYIKKNGCKNNPIPTK